MALSDRIPTFKKLRARHLRFGAYGEKLACRLLRNRGMQIMCCNYHGPNGEIDIVARDGLLLCFVEVKTRRSSRLSRPADAVTAQKKWNLIRTGERYHRQLGDTKIAYRFDIVELIISRGRVLEARHMAGAFSRSDIRLLPNGHVTHARGRGPT